MPKTPIDLAIEQLSSEKHLADAHPSRLQRIREILEEIRHPNYVPPTSPDAELAAPQPSTEVE